MSPENIYRNVQTGKINTSMLGFINFLCDKNVEQFGCCTAVTKIVTQDSIGLQIYHESEGEIEKSIPGITDWHHEACRAMTNGDPQGRIFYPTFTRLMDSFSSSPFYTAFYI